MQEEISARKEEVSTRRPGSKLKTMIGGKVIFQK